MKPRISLLIPFSDVGCLARTLGRIAADRAQVDDIVVSYGPSLEPGVLDRLKKIWPAPLRWIESPSDSPGAVRNAAVAAASGEAVFFLEAGDTIDPRYPELAAELLASRPDLSLVTAFARAPDASGLAARIEPVLTLEAVLASHDPVPGPTVFRRSAWEAVGRFDTSLPSAEWYEFVIRLLANAHGGQVLDEELIGHEPGRDSAYRLRLESDRYVAGLRAVFEKHLDLFRRYVVAALCGRETTKLLAQRYPVLVGQRDRLVAERDSLREETQQLQQKLRALDAHTLDWGELRRVLPLSPDWGYERGVPIDRYYIERFLESHAGDVQGTVLEVQEPDYTRRFGGTRVTRSDVIDAAAANSLANLTGDLRRLEGIPSDTYDCFILTQTIHVIDDMRAVLSEAKRILKPGGVLLVTLPCASRVCLEYGRDGDFWRATEAGSRQLFSEQFPATHLSIQSFGNVLTSVAFLQGAACHEVSAEEFEFFDPYQPLLVGVRAVKPGAGPAIPRTRRAERGAILLYHRVATPPLDTHGLCLPPEVFRAQMEHLVREYRPVPLIQLAMAAHEGWIPDRAVAVTFDDGYFDNLEIASPILLELGIPATFFITNAFVRESTAFWWDVLAWIFLGPALIPPQLDLAGEGEIARLACVTREERQQTHWALYKHLVHKGPAERDAMIHRLLTWAELSYPETAGRPMRRAELMELARRAGHSIGGHGSNHLALPAQADEAIHREVRENRALLETAIGRIVTCFAYPFGDHDDRCVGIVGETGYRAAVTCVAEPVRPGIPPLRLPRFEARPEAVTVFEKEIARLFEISGS